MRMLLHFLYLSKAIKTMCCLCRKVDMLVKDIYGTDYTALGRL
jgi:pantothenate kinase